MSNISRTVLSLLIILCFYTGTLVAQRTVIEKKSKIVTYENQIIWTRHMTISNDSVSFKLSNGSFGNFDMKEVKSISVKIGSSFPAVMGTALGVGLIYSSVNPNTPQNVSKVTFGLVTGGLAGLFVAPFIKQPLTLIYFDGKWKDNRYKPR